MNSRRLYPRAIGLPPKMPWRDGFSIRSLRGKSTDGLNNASPPSMAGSRERKARQMLAILKSGKLGPEAAAGVERDYATELARLRKAAP